MSNLDQIALDVINVWEDSSATNHAQLKAELQVLIIEALKTCRNDALDGAVKVAYDIYEAVSIISCREIGDRIKELKQ